jgi:hypothetical protein
MSVRGETARHLAASGRPEKVIFACFSRRDLECYRAALAEQEGGRGPAARAGQG